MAYKLLVVDDDIEIIGILKSRLSREGYSVSVAFSGEEALEQLKLIDPDVILLDLNLPGLNGLDVLKEIREKHDDKWRPVIIVSAKSELESLKTCYKLEADHYLTKPCNIDDILRGITTMLSLIPLRIKG
ncbi:response regulator [bacterium]|nr:MAG: response regulator [bacterium]